VLTSRCGQGIGLRCVMVHDVTDISVHWDGV
jgi:hypothetical protein